MRFKVDFTKYSLEELYESAESIDRERFAERAELIDALIREKESSLPQRVPGRFYYTKNHVNLTSGYILVVFLVFILYLLYIGEIPFTSFALLEYLFYFIVIGLFICAAYRDFKNYAKLDGKERFIQIGKDSVVMPVHSNSLINVDIPVSEINEIYYSLNRRNGILTGLVIVYEYDKSVSITVGYLSVHDFDAVCALLKKVTKTEKIGEKYI